MSTVKHNRPQEIFCSPLRFFGLLSFCGFFRRNPEKSSRYETRKNHKIELRSSHSLLGFQIRPFRKSAGIISNAGLFLRLLRFDATSNEFKKVLILSQMLPNIFSLFFPLQLSFHNTRFSGMCFFSKKFISDRQDDSVFYTIRKIRISPSASGNSTSHPGCAVSFCAENGILKFYVQQKYGPENMKES